MIEGFKSYRENTYVTFGPGLNVIGKIFFFVIVVTSVLFTVITQVLYFMQLDIMGQGKVTFFLQSSLCFPLNFLIFQNSSGKPCCTRQQCFGLGVPL